MCVVVKTLVEFLQTWRKCTPEHENDLIRFLWTKVKDQGNCDLLNKDLTQ